jgi:crotonobetainyl-CoA:carnitine CoA-transferase CaiB-like acyl-CoA transferase
MTSLSPFGQKGPYKNFRAPDIVVMAMGGVMYVWGDPDRPPVRLSVDQAYLHASADAAVGSIIALYHKEISGEGQHIDVSAQESVTLAILESVPYYDMNGFIRTRTGPVWASISKEDIITKHTWDCRDGYITFEVLGGKAGARFNRALMSWIASEGLRDEMLENINWEEFDYSKATQDVHDRVGFFLGKFFRKHTVKELYQGAVERRIIIYPVTNAKDISEDEQLRARNFWEYIYHPELENTVPYVGSFAKFSNGNFGIKKRAPLIGEHNEEIYKQEYGFTSEDLLIFKQNRVI